MVHQDNTTTPPTSQVKQVEFNTIASSFGGLSYYTSRLHKSVFSIFGVVRGLKLARLPPQ